MEEKILFKIIEEREACACIADQYDCPKVAKAIRQRTCNQGKHDWVEGRCAICDEPMLQIVNKNK
jgi:hypothetical protein